MTIPVQSEVQFGMVSEVTMGTTPATPVFQKLRDRGGSRIHINRPRLEASERRADRNLGSTYGGIGGGTGRIQSLLFHETFMHDLLEMALCSTFSTNLLKNGVAQKSYTFERKVAAGGNTIFDRLTGALVDKMALSIVPNQEATIDFDLLAMGGASDSAIISGATYTAPSTGEAADYGDVSAVTLFGLTNFSLVRLDLGLANNLAPQPALGQRDMAGIRLGKQRVNGMAQIYCEDPAFYAAGLSNTTGSMGFTVGPIGGSSGARYTFLLPNAIISDTDFDDSSGDGILTLNFMAQFDNSSSSQIEVTKNA
jgi:hypothetical protein